MLTEAAIRAAKATGKLFKLYDEKGLFLLVTASGSRLWRVRYFLNGEEKLLAAIQKCHGAIESRSAVAVAMHSQSAEKAFWHDEHFFVALGGITRMQRLARSA